MKMNAIPAAWSIKMRERGGGSRRAFVLIVVLLVLMGVLLAAVGLLHRAAAAQLSRRGDSANVQSKLLEESAVAVLLRAFAAQRGDILASHIPAVERRFIFFETQGIRCIAVMLPIDAAGSVISSEAARLNVNVATENMLARLPGIDEELAGNIVAARAQRPSQRFGSVDALLEVSGMTAATLFGVDAKPLRMPAFDEQSAAGAFNPHVDTLREEPQLIDLLTVHSLEPNVDSESNPRVTVAGEWSAELRDELIKRFGEALTTALESLARAPSADASDASIVVRALRDTKHPLEEWSEVLDAVSFTAAPMLVGLVDVNSAPREVLAAVPGISAEAADSIVQVRRTLRDEERASITWPYDRGVLEEASFVLAAPHLTTRSCVFRTRVMVIEGIPGPHELEILQPQVRGVMEIIIDVSDEKPRVLSRKNLTHRNLALILTRDAESAVSWQGE